jgi:hypothetical protein
VGTFSAQVSDPIPDSERFGWTVALCLLLLFSLQNWGTGGAMSIAVVISVFCTFTTLGLLAWGWAAGLHRAIPLVAMTALTLTSLGVAAAQLATTTGYGTDAIAFNEYAASLVLNGENPYTHDMSPALSAFHIPVTNTTLTFDGSFVTDLSYPAGSFLFYAAANALGLGFHTAPIVNAIAWAITLWILFVVLPRPYKWAAVVFGTGTAFAGLSAAGLNDVLFLPFMLLAIYHWDRFTDITLPLLHRYSGPICLGIACSIKQTPWFAAPLLVIGIAVSMSGPPQLAPAFRYLLTAILSFALLNLPFFISAPGAWLHGITLPLMQPLIVDGQGIVSLATLTGFGGGRIQLFTLSAAAAYLALLLSMAAFHHALRRAWLPLLAIVLLLPARSLAIYAALWAPLIALAVVTVQSTSPRQTDTGFRPLRLLAIGSAGVATVLAACALAWPAPMRIEVVDATIGSDRRVESVAIRITNTTARPLTYLLTLNAGGQPSQVWSSFKGQRRRLVLGPHSTTSRWIYPANDAGRPGQSSLFRIQAFTSSPRSVSVSDQWGPAVEAGQIALEGDRP